MSEDIDINSILKEYSFAEDDFGFSTVSAEEYNSEIDSALSMGELAAETYKKKLIELEKLMVPFLMRLLKTADKEYIYWPNRKSIIEDQIQKIVKLTRT